MKKKSNTKNARALYDEMAKRATRKPRPKRKAQAVAWGFFVHADNEWSLGGVHQIKARVCRWRATYAETRLATGPVFRIVGPTK